MNRPELYLFWLGTVCSWILRWTWKCRCLWSPCPWALLQAPLCPQVRCRGTAESDVTPYLQCESPFCMNRRWTQSKREPGNELRRLSQLIEYPRKTIQKFISGNSSSKAWYLISVSDCEAASLKLSNTTAWKNDTSSSFRPLGKRAVITHLCHVRW